MKNKFFAVLLLAFATLLLSCNAQYVLADVFPAERAIHFSRNDVSNRVRYPLYFNCVGADRKVTNIAVSNVSTNSASISWSQHTDNHGGSRYLEIIPTKGGGTVSLTVTARGDSGRSYKTMVEIIVD
ncbi:MAG: hypothetical protein Q4C78_01560 [Synergistaceae bacterium]|nr:hypothetical protein [Synergistaceae bacterium]